MTKFNFPQAIGMYFVIKVDTKTFYVQKHLIDSSKEYSENELLRIADYATEDNRFLKCRHSVDDMVLQMIRPQNASPINSFLPRGVETMTLGSGQ